MVRQWILVPRSGVRIPHPQPYFVIDVPEAPIPELPILELNIDSGQLHGNDKIQQAREFYKGIRDVSEDSAPEKPPEQD